MTEIDGTLFRKSAGDRIDVVRQPVWCVGEGSRIFWMLLIESSICINFEMSIYFSELIHL